jgi:hypothetical protein
MKAGSVGSHLHMVDAYHQEDSSKPDGLTMQISSWMHRVTYLRPLALILGCVETAYHVPEQSSRHVQRLRACIQSGIYRVDSITLARCIIVNETHFLQMHWE